MVLGVKIWSVVFEVRTRSVMLGIKTCSVICGIKGLSVVLGGKTWKQGLVQVMLVGKQGYVTEARETSRYSV